MLVYVFNKFKFFISCVGLFTQTACVVNRLARVGHAVTFNNRGVAVALLERFIFHNAINKYPMFVSRVVLWSSITSSY